MTTRQILYPRVLLKLSGEAFTESGVRGILRRPMDAVIAQIKSVWPDHQVAVTVGGGNIYRGSQLMRDLAWDEQDAVDADWCGMMATHLNGIALKRELRKAGVEARLMLAKPYGDIGEPFYMDVADSHLTKGRVIVLAGGTGKPRFTTDTGAIQSACEIRADLVLKGTKVDGIYDSDPSKNPGAVRIPHIDYDGFIARKLAIMDTAAVAMARDNRKRIRVFDIFEPGSLARVLADSGTYSDIGL